MDSLKKNKFLPLLIHEMRAPVNLIISHTHKAMKIIDRPCDVKNELELINNLSFHILLLINDILDFSKLSNDHITLNYEEINLYELLDNFYSLYEAQCSPKNIKFTLTKNMVHANIMGDSVRLLTILNNLMANAVKFTPEFGTINLEVNQQHLDNKIRTSFIVSDTGIGMSKEFIDDIFKPYTQESCKYGGTGLGMMMVKELVNLMKGNISVNSTKGIGTVFTVTIDFNMPPNIEEIIYDFSEKRVLIVDDSEINLELTSDFLQLTNIKIDCVSNGKEAVDKFIEQSKINPYDAILMDLRMPIMDGIQATKIIRNLDCLEASKVKIIALTAGSSDEDKKQAIASGMNDIIIKPIDVKLLYRTLYKYFYKTV